MNQEAKIVLLQRINKVPEHFAVATQKMEELGITNFHFYGGAIRDHLLGEDHNDVDVQAVFPKYDPFWINVRNEIGRLPRSTGFGFFRHHISTNLEDIFRPLGLNCESVTTLKKEEHILKLSFEGKSGRKEIIDLKLVEPEEIQRTNLLSVYECPINSLTLRRDGTIWGNPKAPEHLEARIFEPQAGLPTLRTIKALMRCAKINNRIGGITFQPREGEGVIAKAWNFAQKMTGIPDRLSVVIYDYKRTIIRVEPK